MSLPQFGLVQVTSPLYRYQPSAIKLLFPLLLFSFTAAGQISIDGINPNITNSRTGDHINIPGTRLYIIPPADFIVSNTFIGLQKDENSIVNIYDLVGGDVNTNAAHFNKEIFESAGATVFDYQEINVNGYPAKYISLLGDLTSKVYALIFGDTTFSTMIVAIYPASDEATGKNIIKALNTLWYDKSKIIDPFATATFSLDDTVSKFKFFQYNANTYLYSVGGVDNNDDKNTTAVIVSQFPKESTTSVKSIADMMILKAREYGLSNIEVKNVSTQPINGYDTYEVEVYGEMEGSRSLIYYCIVAKEETAIVVQGIAKNDIETNLLEFKKLVSSIKIK